MEGFKKQNEREQKWVPVSGMSVRWANLDEVSKEHRDAVMSQIAFKGKGPFKIKSVTSAGVSLEDKNGKVFWTNQAHICPIK